MLGEPMERVAPIVSSVEESAPTSCPICEGALELSSRCGQCGAAAKAGKYRTVRELSRRAHGRVYLAVDGSGRQVALKEICFNVVPDVQHLEALDREAAMLRQLDHPRIPRFVDSFREGQGAHLRLYLAQEFVPGRSLLQLLDERRFAEHDLRLILRQALELLVYLQERSPRVIHRDVKPANLLMGEDGRLVLVDFGSARDIALGGTVNGTLTGTFGYVPPEQLGGIVDETSDLYALGATAIHLLSRKAPHELMGPALRLDFERHVNCSAGLQRFLARLTARETFSRFTSAGAALRALDSLEEPGTADREINPAALRALAFEKPPVETSGKRVKRLVEERLFELGVLVLALCAVAGFWLISSVVGIANRSLGTQPEVAPSRPAPPVVNEAALRLREKVAAERALREAEIQRAKGSQALARGEQALAAGDFLGALTDAMEAMQLLPATPEAARATLLKARALGKQKRFDDACAVYGEYLEEFPAGPDVQAALGERALLSGELANAEVTVRDCSALLERFPAGTSADEVMLLRGRAQARLGLTDQAAVDFTTLIARNPEGSPVNLAARAALAELAKKAAPPADPRQP